MSWLLGALAVMFVLDGLRARARLRKLAVLAPPRVIDRSGPDSRPAPSDVAADHVVVLAPGVTLDDATRRAASAHARRERLDVLDLIPGDAHVSTQLGLVALVDPAAYRGASFAQGRTAGYAIVATRDVLERAGWPEPPQDPAAFQRYAATLKRYASKTADFAVAPALRALPRDPNAQRAVVEVMMGEFYVWVMLLPLALAAVIGYGALGHPLAAAAAVACYHAAVAIAFAGVTRPRGLASAIALRLPLDVWRSLALLADRRRPDVSRIDELRPAYDELLAGGWERFFEPASKTCVHCGADALKKLWSTGDHFQQKPGRFTLVRCTQCGVVFQNPRLTQEGLAFYYRDYYDGLGAEITEFAFSQYGPVYANRAKMVKALTSPKKWLDVGCGHGHFCCAARPALPDVELDGLDWGESVEDARRRKWIDRAHRGSLPALASSLRGRYDVVSMFHYLEHVLDPAAEIAAAREVLEPGGYLVIEVPEPDSRVGRALGRLWVNWLQPQHLRFLSIRHLDELLRAHGFTPVTWHRAEAHMPIDLSWAMVLLLQRLGPLTDKPWKPPSTPLQRFRRRLVWTLGAPFVLLAGAIDRLLAAFAGPLRSWNLYRVAARLDASEAVNLSGSQPLVDRALPTRTSASPCTEA